MQNRQQRRAAKKMLVTGTKRIPISQVLQMGKACIWDGCTNSFSGVMPPGWQWMIRYSAPRPEIPSWTHADWLHRSYQDVCLCPEHVRALNDLLLIGFPYVGDMEPEGAA